MQALQEDMERLRTRLSKIGEQLMEWGSSENNIMSYMPTRQEWTEAVQK